jgi:hypothetical protein
VVSIGGKGLASEAGCELLFQALRVAGLDRGGAASRGRTSKRPAAATSGHVYESRFVT